MQKRKDFEYLLVRRAPAKSDYLRYIAYELSLDALRIKRKARLGKCCQWPPPTTSKHHLIPQASNKPWMRTTLQ